MLGTQMPEYSHPRPSSPWTDFPYQETGSTEVVLPPSNQHLVKNSWVSGTPIHHCLGGPWLPGSRFPQHLCFFLVLRGTVFVAGKYDSECSTHFGR